MRGAMHLFGFIMLFLTSCSEMPDWHKAEDNGIITQNEFNTNETEIAANTTLFLAQIAACSISELEAGQLAEKKARTRSVKGFAAEMVHQQRGVNAALKQLEQQMHINLATLPPADCEPITIALNSKKHKSFDRDFMDAIIMNHKKVISLLVNATADNINLDIKVFITEALPKLQLHLGMAENIRNELP